jgi:hypothetical protein
LRIANWRGLIKGTLFSRFFLPVLIATPARRSYVLNAAKGSTKSGLIAEARQQGNLSQTLPTLGEQLFGVLDS